jgi:hypothetical protein
LETNFNHFVFFRNGMKTNKRCQSKHIEIATMNNQRPDN